MGPSERGEQRPLRTAGLPLAGRKEELEAIGRLLEGARRGVGGTLVLEGEAGIGKTRLVQEAERIALSSSFELFSVACEEIERTQPLRAVERAARTSGFDSDGASPDAEAILEAIEVRALSRPVLVVIDDLHWADPATLTFLRSATARTEVTRLAIIATTRPWIRSHDLARVFDRLTAEGVTFVSVGALGPDEVAELVGSAVGGDDVASLVSDLDRAGGNPFYVLEVVSALLEDGQSVGGGALPPSLRLTIQRRLATLPAETLDLVKTCSLLGSRFDARDLVAVTQWAPLDLSRGLAPALDAGFLTEDGGQLAFRHDLVRSALYEDMPAAIRGAAHRQIADALIAADRPAPVIAAHLLHGAEKGDDVAVSWIDAAGGQIVAGESTLAIELFRRAVELAGDDELAHRMSLQLARALFLAGRCREAELVLRRILDAGVGPDLTSRAQRMWGYTLFMRGMLKEADVAFALDAEGADEHRRSEADVLRGLLAFAMGEVDAAEGMVRQHLDHQDPGVRMIGQMVQTQILSSRGEVRAAARHGRATAHSEDDDNTTQSSLSSMRLTTGIALLEADEIDAALEQLHTGFRRIEHANAQGLFGEFERTLSLVRYVTGDFTAASTYAQASVEADGNRLMQIQGAEVPPLWTHAVAARIHLHRGRLSDARSTLAAAHDAARAGVRRDPRDLVTWCEALILEAEGEGARALGLLVSSWDGLEPFRYFGGLWRLIAADLVRVALAAGRPEVARPVVAIAEEGARLAEGAGSAHLAAMRLRGVVAGDGELVLAAAGGLRQAGRLVEAASTLSDAAAVLAAGGNDPEPAMREALATYLDLDAPYDADRVRAAMRTNGIRIGVRGARKRPTFGWEALTPTELRVVELVAEGLTNAAIGDRLFISRRTVQTHLRNIFNKLGIASRVELATEAARHSAE